MQQATQDATAKEGVPVPAPHEQTPQRTSALSRSEAQVVGRIVSRHIRGNRLELQGAAGAALEVAKLFARAVHHLAHDVVLVRTRGLADAAAHDRFHKLRTSWRSASTRMRDHESAVKAIATATM